MLATDATGRLMTLSDNVAYCADPIIPGSSAAVAAPSAKYIQTTFGVVTDGVYWINLPTVGATQVYCIMDPAVAGGGWMLAMKGTRGNVFKYASTHWTTASTLNASAPSRSDADAKYDVFNHFPATDWLATFPDTVVSSTDAPSLSYFAWLENNAVGSTSTVRAFMASNTPITKLSTGRYGTTTTPTPMNSSKYDGRVWSSQTTSQWYGFNRPAPNAGWPSDTRWGFTFNNEASDDTPDAFGGIGEKSSSACDTLNGSYGQTNQGLNRTMRFEWFVR